MLVFVEPEAFDFWLKLGERCELIADVEGEEAPFDFVATEEGVTVYPEPGCGQISVIQDGKELICGHGRPSDWP